MSEACINDWKPSQSSAVAFSLKKPSVFAFSYFLRSPFTLVVPVLPRLTDSLLFKSSGPSGDA